MLDVEQAIREVGSVYRAVTGRDIEPGRSELPAEIDARSYIEGRYRQLENILASPETARPAGRHASWAPPMEVSDHGQEVRYSIDLPGVARDAVSVSAVGEWLVVRGRRAVAQASGIARRYDERATGTFERVIPLPPRARRDAVHASLHDGVLVIGVPLDGRPVAAKPIEIK